MKIINYKIAAQPQWISSRYRNPITLTDKGVQIALAILASVGVGIAVIVSTYYVENFKLLIGLVGGIVFVLLTMRWPEFGILCLLALLSGLVSLSWLPLLHLGPISLHISDIMLSLLLVLLFLRVTTQRGFMVFRSPLTLPLLLFISAFLFSAAYAIFVYHVGMNVVLRTVRVLILWIVFIPTLQLVRDEQALRRLLIGLLLFTGILLIGVIFPNRLGPILAVEEGPLSTGTNVYSGFSRMYYDGDKILYAMIPVTIASLAMIKKGKQIWRVGLLALLIFWAFKSGYREFWLTLLVICVLLLLIFTTQERIRLLKRLVPAMVAGAVLVCMLLVTQPKQVERVVYVLTDRLGSLLHGSLSTENSLKWRATENYYALIQIRRHPILGVGLSNKFRPPMEAENNLSIYNNWTSTYLESGFLWIVLMMGLVGLLPFLWLCGAYLLQVFRHHREIRDDSLRAVYLGFGAAFLGMVACNFATPIFTERPNLIFYPLAMAICEVILRLAREKSWSTN